ncbi:MAG: maltose 6-phosphate phosphatase [Thermosipho sp. (in: thermotogales)]|nr:maltose 6-phosphate phosphatase [Thermosipho sp. (in: thermotogales)]
MLKILTLNLHTFQEVDLNDAKNLKHFFRECEKIQNKITQFILDEDIDIAVFQEAAQHKDMKIIEEKFRVYIKEKNYIKTLRELLLKDGKFYEYAWDWSHYGWNIWEEGLGILNRYPITDFENRYVSEIKDVSSFYSRKLLKASVNFNSQIIDVYIVHFNWIEKGFKKEYKELVDWVNESSNDRFIIAGDFNVEAGTEEYKEFISMKVKGQELIDVFLETNSNNFKEATFRGDKFTGSSRIDYILTSKHFKAIESKVVFKDDDKYGRVSDHMGLYAKLELIE